MLLPFIRTNIEVRHWNLATLTEYTVPSTWHDHWKNCSLFVLWFLVPSRLCQDYNGCTYCSLKWNLVCERYCLLAHCSNTDIRLELVCQICPRLFTICFVFLPVWYLSGFQCFEMVWNCRRCYVTSPLCWIIKCAQSRTCGCDGLGHTLLHNKDNFFRFGQSWKWCAVLIQIRFKSVLRSQALQKLWLRYKSAAFECL